MPLVDSKGRLFGLVNVVDLLVVVVVLGVAVASLALLVGSSNEEDPAPVVEPQRYATLSFQAPLESDAAEIQVGDTLSSNGGDVLEVVDLHRTFNATGSAHLTVRGAYRGDLTDGNGPVYGGDVVDLTTARYRVYATVLSVNETDRPIPTRTVPVVLAINTSSPVERYLQPDQEIQLGGETVATVRTIRDPGSASARLLVGVDLRAWDRGGTAVFGGRALRVGTPVTLVTDEVVLRGRVHELDTTEPSSD